MANAASGTALGRSTDSSARGTSRGCPTSSSWSGSPPSATRRPSRPWSRGTGRWSWRLPGRAEGRARRRGRLPGDLPGPGPQGRLAPGQRDARRLALPGGVPHRRPGQRRGRAAARARADGDGPGGRAQQKTEPWDDWLPVLHEEIDRLPERHRRPVVLCDLEGMTYEQAAQELRWTEPTLRCRLAQARERLRGPSDSPRRGLGPARPWRRWLASATGVRLGGGTRRLGRGDGPGGDGRARRSRPRRRP